MVKDKRRMQIFDSHCHLDFESFGADLDDVLSRAHEAGVTRMATIGAGAGRESAVAAVELAKRYPGRVHATIGVHPHDAGAIAEPLWDELQDLAGASEVCAIGETGLDFHYNHSTKDAQEDAFRRFIGMAKDVGKPLVIHTRNAAAETLRILREEKASDVGGIIHCFSEDAAFAKSALDLGFVASFSGIVTFKSAAAIADAAKHQPADSILVETDAPFLAPIPFRGKRCEPAFVVKTLEFIAQLRGIAPDTLAEQTFNNTCRVYQLPHGT